MGPQRPAAWIDPDGPVIVAGTVPGPATVKPLARPKPTSPNNLYMLN